MPKITKKEFLNNIKNIINEGMNTDPHAYDGTTLFNIQKYINDLITEGLKNPYLMSYLVEYDNALKAGKKDFLLFESFGRGLSQYAKGNRSVKSVINAMNETLKQYGNELKSYLIIEGIKDPYANKVIKDAYNTYVAEPTRETKDNLLEALDVLYKQDNKSATDLHVLISENASNTIPYFNSYLTESEFVDVDKQINQSIEEEKLRKVQEQVQAYAEQVFEDAEQEERELKESMTFQNIVNSNGIDMIGAIKKIVNSDAVSNHKLMEMVDEYAGAIQNGAYEERLYETFTKKLSAFDYLVPVEEAIKHINENIKGKELPIFITKTLETMADSTSYFIVPLIEESCATFVKNPNATNRVQLRQALSSFASNPYVFQIIEAIEKDDSLANNTLAEQALNVQDRIKLIRQNATISDVYSPIQYIKENECIFNVRGQFYVKKGNNLSKIDENYTNKLSPKFIELCRLVNDPSVIINEDKIILASSDNIAEIYEGYADINGIRETQQTLRDLTGMRMKYDTADDTFFVKCSCLLENFNNIANVNFSKHVSLNENSHINFDLFNLGDHIFINAVNEDVEHSTFYRDVNPIQCKNIINNHMGINVASLFENLIPSQEKILVKLNETRDEYQNNIDKLEETISKAKDALENCTSEEGKEKLQKAIKTANEKLSNLKKEYKEWQKEVKKVTGEKTDDDELDSDDEASDDGGTREETTDEPLTDKEVKDEKVKDELSTPLTDDIEEENTDEDSDEFTVSNSEFAEYLDDSEDVENSDDEEDADNEDSDEDSDDEPIDFDVNDDDTESEDSDDFDFNIATEDEEDSDDFDFNADAETDIKTTDIGSGEEVKNNEIEDDDNNSNDAEIDPDEATDIFGGNSDIPMDDDQEDGYTDEDDGYEEETETDDEITEPSNTTPYTIVDVMWDQNMKTGEMFKSGNVSTIIHMISGDGRLFSDSKTFEFYLGPDNMPVIGNDTEMPVDLYKSIVDAIVNSDEYGKFSSEGIDKNTSTETSSNDTMNNDDIAVVKVEPENTTNTEEVSSESSDEYSDDNSDDFVYTEDDTEETPDYTNDFKSIFDIDDDDDSFSISLNTDDNGDETLEYTDEPETTDDSEDFVIPTYSDGETEYELPAPNVDGSELPEITSEEADTIVNTPKKNKNLIKVKPVYKDSDFFVKEGKANPSKTKADDSVNESEILEPIEEYEDSYDDDVLLVIHDDAISDKLLLTDDGIEIKVTPITTYEEKIQYFTIENELASYTIYRIDNEIYYRESDEFYQILQDLEDEVPGQTEEALKVLYTKDAPMDSVSVFNLHDCKFVISAIIQSLTGQTITHSVSESIKIRKPAISNEHDIDKSKFADDIIHGDADKREFEEEVEKESQKENIENPLVPAADKTEETVKTILPNVHSITESKKTVKKNKKENIDEPKFFFEPMDKVIYQDMKSQVLAVSEDGNQVNILTPNGQKIVNAKELEPDIEYVSPLRNTPKQFDFDKDNLTTNLQDSQPGPLHDLNGKTIDCDIIVDNFKLNLAECHASLDDIMQSKKQIRVINENGVVELFDTDNIAFIETPYAVVVDNDGKPIRTVQIYADSYINAGDDELVLCKIDGKDTKFPKSKIQILS